MPKPPSQLRNLSGLKELVAALRGPDGCPWDKEQDHLSLCPYAIEEVFELIEVIEKNDDPKMKEELGDVLFQVALHAQLAEERGAFNLEDVIETLNKKMVHRHPHVFSDQVVAGTEEVLKNWEALKAKENANLPSSKASLNVPVHLPALQRAAKIGFRTHKLKFDWPDAKSVWSKVNEEFGELTHAIKSGKTEEIAEELGDLYFSLAQLARHLELDPEQVARSANRKFENRFAKMMLVCEEKNMNWHDLGPEQKLQLWEEVKRVEKLK